MLKPAVDKIIDNPKLLHHCGRIGIVCNQASTSSYFIPTPEVIYDAAKILSGVKVTAVFGPQHGFYQTEQDNMKETEDSVYRFSDGQTVPLFSLYSATREPTDEQIKDIDTLIIDLQDIGCRIYTYMLTLAGCLRVAAKHHKKVVVLDRVNPLGLGYYDPEIKTVRRVEGNVLDTKWLSFVGWYKMPFRHGLTIGELGAFFIQEDNLKVKYEVLKVQGLTRRCAYQEIGRIPWVMPSPNIPTLMSTYLFPMFVSLEAATFSEGRGTTQPFEIVGAPYFEPIQAIRFLEEYSEIYLYQEKKSIQFREHHFRPTFNKFKDEMCKGIQSHILDPENINLFHMGMLFLYYCVTHHGMHFQWKEPGYEYNFKDPILNLILGDSLWLEYFEEARQKSHCENMMTKLKELLNSSEKQSYQFYTDVSNVMLYK